MSGESVGLGKTFVDAGSELVKVGHSIVQKMLESGDDCDGRSVIREIEKALLDLADALEYSSRAELIGHGNGAIELLIFATQRYGVTNAVEELRAMVFGWVAILDKDELVDLFLRVIDLGKAPE